MERWMDGWLDRDIDMLMSYLSKTLELGLPAVQQLRLPPSNTGVSA